MSAEYGGAKLERQPHTFVWVKRNTKDLVVLLDAQFDMDKPFIVQKLAMDYWDVPVDNEGLYKLLESLYDPSLIGEGDYDDDEDKD